MIKQFRVAVPEAQVADLRARLHAARVASTLEQHSWSAGASASFVQELCHYFATEFDWRAQEARLNALPQFVTDLGGVSLHFVHKKSAHTQAVPLLLIHGWPGSFFEFHKILPLLTTSSGQSFHVVCPSLPGFAWSDPCAGGIDHVADLLDGLMQRLGYTEYVVQGGDWGALVARAVAVRHPRRCLALLVNMSVPCIPQATTWVQTGADIAWLALSALAPRVFLSAEDRAGLKNTLDYVKFGSAYMIMQAAKPQTLGFALNDSPVGLCAWIAEKFHDWADHGHGNGLFSVVSKDDLLTNGLAAAEEEGVFYFHLLMKNNTQWRYTGYYETLPLHIGGSLYGQTPPFCSTPTCISRFPKEILQAPVAWMKLGHNVQEVFLHPSGGHFAALEQPDELARDITAFVFRADNLSQWRQAARQRPPSHLKPLQLRTMLGVGAIFVLLSAVLLMRVFW